MFYLPMGQAPYKNKNREHSASREQTVEVNCPALKSASAAH